MPAIRAAERSAYAEAALSEIQSVAYATADSVERYPANIFLTDSALQHQIFDQAPDGIIGEGGDWWVTGVEPQHDFTETHQVPDAVLFRLNVQLCHGCTNLPALGSLCQFPDFGFAQTAAVHAVFIVEVDGDSIRTCGRFDRLLEFHRSLRIDGLQIRRGDLQPAPIEHMGNQSSGEKHTEASGQLQAFYCQRSGESAQNHSSRGHGH